MSRYGVRTGLNVSFAVALAFNALGLAMLMSGVEPQTTPAATPPLKPTSMNSMPVEAVERAYTETFQRPLFMRSRLPYEPPPPSVPQSVLAPPAPPPAAMLQPPPPAGPRLDRSIRVAGIIVDSRTSRALVIAASNPLGEWLGIGGEIGGWTLAEITREGIVLTAGDQRLTAALYPR
jgi:hypothetical protein